jgi:structural maintenance of chromosome 2
VGCVVCRSLQRQGQLLILTRHPPLPTCQVFADFERASATIDALSKRVNKKVMQMFEKAEQEYNELKRKKDVVETDKRKIEEVMEELDEKKREALETTWRKVTEDFGSIFSTLLPGTTAKLEPEEGKSFLDGLEVRVAFGGVWKDSLSELSGGQKSLLALSLILAMLLFKPAPIYILDEVDAALDLSHTQNIGRMIKAHFPQSQFIVVSLKEGMFNNANVIYRTKFLDGVSTVSRTVNSSADGPSAASKQQAARGSKRPALQENAA